MSLLAEKPTERTHAQDVVDEVKKSNYNFVKAMASQAEYNIKHCWQDDKHTPQEFFDQFGTYAESSVKLNAALIGLIHQYEQTIGEKLFNYAMLADIKPYTINVDGTITVN